MSNPIPRLPPLPPTPLIPFHQTRKSGPLSAHPAKTAPTYALPWACPADSNPDALPAIDRIE
jgi:hypothetical protein